MTSDRLYGNWQRQQRVSLRGVDLPAAVTATAGYLGGLVVLQFDPTTGAATLAGCVALTAASAVRIGGTTLPAWAAGTARWRWACLTGRRTHEAPDRDGTRQLPGPLARTQMLDITSPTGDYGAVHDPRTRRVAVTFLVTPTAADLVDPPEADATIGRWERWLESLGHRPEVATVHVTVETTPHAGPEPAPSLSDRITRDAPADCRALMAHLAQAIPQTAARTDVRVTVTFDLRTWDRHTGPHTRHDVAAYVPALGRAVEGLQAGLDGCGVNVRRRATVVDLCDATLTAFDLAPAAGPARAADEPTWQATGPAATLEERESYRHGRARSASFVWAQAPRQLVTSSVLAAIARPGRFGKRLTLVYVATPAAAAMDAAMRQVRRRRLTMAVAGLPVVGRAATAQDERDAAAAEQSTREVAAGAGWIAQTLLVTTSVTDDADLHAAVVELEHAAAASQLRLRRLVGLQAAAFAAGLPAGLHLPDLAREWNR